MSNISLIQKIAKVRKEFAEAGVKKSGKNKYAGFSYFELADILPKCNELCDKHGILPVFSFYESHAELKVYDANSEATIDFNVCTSIEDINARMGADKQSRGMQPVQRLGSVITYTKRYLYVNFLDIVENDAIDSAEPQREPNKQATSNEREQLVLQYTQIRTKLQSINVDFKEPTTANWIEKTAKVSTQDVNALNDDELKSLIKTYNGVYFKKSN